MSKLLGEEHSHESYGNVRVGRITGTTKLHGSHLSVSNFFSIEISRAIKSHELGSDFHFGTQELIEIYLTPMQFIELITTNSSGVPCTIKTFNGERMKPVPEDDKTETENVKEYFNKKIQELSATALRSIEEVDVLLNKKNITLKDREDLKASVYRINQEIQSNIEFYLRQFEKSTSKVVMQAKSEVDAFANMIVREAGIQAIAKGNLPQISFKEDL